MSVLTVSDDRAPAGDLGRRAMALSQVRTALAMVSDDPVAGSLPATTAPSPDPTAPLTDWLYARWWCGPAQVGAGEPADRAEASRGAARLEAARRIAADRSSGWLVLAAVADRLVAARLDPHQHVGTHTGRRIQTTTEAVVASSRPGLPTRPGDLVALRHGESGLDPTGSWWWVHTGRAEDSTTVPLDRWYIHARDLTAATDLVPLLLAVAAESGCDISLKCPPWPNGYGRRDAMVVYLPRERATAAEMALLRRSELVAEAVLPDTPPLTRLLLPGVAQAQDPGSGDTEHEAISYGQLRCSQVAAVANRLLTRDRRPTEITDEALVAALTDVGIDVAAVQRVSTLPDRHRP